MGEAQAKARDAERKLEVDAIRKALAFYYIEHGQYPESSDWLLIEEDDEDDGFFSQALEEYLPEMPRDPLYPNHKNDDPEKPFSYQYSTGETGGENYMLYVEMESDAFAQYTVSSPTGDGGIFYGGGEEASGGWIVQNNPSDLGDHIKSIVVGSSYIYAGGYDHALGNEQWRIEKRDTNTGALVASFGSGGVVQNNPSGGGDYVNSIAVDSNYIYAGGDNAHGLWRIEKRDIITGALVSSFGSSGVVQNDPSSGVDILNSIAIDSSYIYAGGYDNALGDYQWRIEKRDIETGLVGE